MQDQNSGGMPGSTPADPSASPAVNAAASAQSLAGQARQTVAGSLDSQKGAAADFIAELAQTVQRSGEEFEGRQDWIASAIGRGADELNTFANSMRDKDLGELAGQVASFAKRQPALFVGASLAAGFAVARIGKVVAGDLSRRDLPTMPEVGNGQH